ncbi:hypothetical protein QWY31_14850 [Cytophagales bacterium LB-30]|uniref:Uncharacterized protein n=1 Tax=Shiella aurantiaca TaxID=3058365 RepID=A0ABT8F921_9BACT|nr:hypothetical protein [Shiella aurantiaca]MDN4166788.1 hypothetical protein [Shiella aurantiaca]
MSGFEAGKVYDGRSFNGLYEVSPHWGRGGQSKLIGRGTFQEYFEIVNENVLVNQTV